MNRLMNQERGFLLRRRDAARTELLLTETERIISGTDKEGRREGHKEGRDTEGKEGRMEGRKEERNRKNFKKENGTQERNKRIYIKNEVKQIFESVTAETSADHFNHFLITIYQLKLL